MIRQHARTVGVLAVVATLVLWGGAAASVHAPTEPTPVAADDPVADGVAADSDIQQANASVTFDDQPVENGTVTVQNATLPEGGYVTIHDSTLLEGDALGSVVGVSDYLEPGTHENVTVTLYEGVPGADFSNATVPNGTETLVAMPHLETSTAGDAGNETVGDETDGAMDNETVGDETDGAMDNETVANETMDDEMVDGETADNQTTDTPTYDFVATNGSEDGPYTTDGEPVVDSAMVAFGGDDGSDTDAQTTGITVETLEAPAYAATNSTVTVNATLVNEDPAERTEDVAFRLEGGSVDVVVHERVTVPADNSTTVTFEVNTTGVPADEYIHGVTTLNSSEFSTITVTDDAAVDIDEQETTGENVTVSEAFLPEGGYVTIHDSTLLEGDAVGSVVGVSEYLEPGYYEDLTVTLDEELAENDTLVAMPHLETTDDETYDFVTSDGEDDGPYTTDGEAVTDDANVSVVDAEDDASLDGVNVALD